MTDDEAILMVEAEIDRNRPGPGPSGPLMRPNTSTHVGDVANVVSQWIAIDASN
jgi:hypothetical protein